MLGGLVPRRNHVSVLFIIIWFEKAQQDMITVQHQQLAGPSVWKGADFATDTSWKTHLSPAEIAGIDAMLAQLEQRGASFPEFDLDGVSIGPVAQTLDAIAHRLEEGPGFHLLRGLPLERYSEAQINIVYYAMGLYMGTPVKQNPQGDLLGRVMNVGDIEDKNTRVYETNLYLPYHTDPSDVVGLLCVRKAQQGGMSSLVSSAAVYNEILARRPDLIAAYYEQFYIAHLGSDESTPIFSFNEGKLSCRYLRQYFHLAYEQHGVEMSDTEMQALDLFDEIMMSPEMRIDMMMEPGDIQFANNYAVLHSRTSFEDAQDEAQRRKKLRLWLKMPNARTLAPEFPGRNGFS